MCDGGNEGIDASGSGGFEGLGAFVEGGSAGGDVVHEAEGFAFEGVAVSDGERVFDVGSTLGFGQAPLAASVAGSHQVGTDGCGRGTDAARQVVGLIVAAFETTTPMQRDGDETVDFAGNAADGEGVFHHAAEAWGVFGTLMKLEGQNEASQGGLIDAGPNDSIKGEFLVLTGAAAIIDDTEGACVAAAAAAIVGGDVARQFLPADAAEAVVVAADRGLTEDAVRGEKEVIQAPKAPTQNAQQTGNRIA